MADVDEMVATINRATLQLGAAIGALKQAEDLIGQAQGKVMAMGGQTPGDTLTRYQLHCNNAVDSANQMHRQITRAMTTGQEFIERLFS